MYKEMMDSIGMIQSIVASVPLYNIFSVLVLTVTAPDAQQADHRGLVGKTLRGIITNPIILGIFAGLPFSLLAIDFPPMLDKGLSMLGNCATPMALLSSTGMPCLHGRTERLQPDRHRRYPSYSGDHQAHGRAFSERHGWRGSLRQRAPECND